MRRLVSFCAPILLIPGGSRAWICSSAMQACLILNPNAGSAEEQQWVEQIVDRFGCEVCPTNAPGHASRLAKEAPGKGFDTVIAAGGDGTIHEIVNGLMAADHTQIRLAIIPLGTGNDFVRTLAIPDDPLAAIETIAQGRETRLDLMKVRTAGRMLYACNVAAGGFTGQMNEAMTDEIKQTWGPLAYLRGALKVLPDLTSYRTFMRLDDEPEQTIAAYNLIIANGRTAGGGVVVAPRANPEDGLLDVVIVHAGTIGQMAEVAARLLAGDYTDSDAVTHRQARKIAVHSEPGMWFNVDGELISNEPIEIVVVPRRLRVIVGDAYTAEPDSGTA